MREGRFVAEFSREEATQEKIATAMMSQIVPNSQAEKLTAAEKAVS
jgi:ABC-type uncharacterized transport system ATPase subunit